MASPISPTSICGGLLEAVTCVVVRKDEEMAGDGIGGERSLNPGPASFKQAVLDSYGFVVCVISLPS